MDVEVLAKITDRRCAQKLYRIGKCNLWIPKASVLLSITEFTIINKRIQYLGMVQTDWSSGYPNNPDKGGSRSSCHNQISSGPGLWRIVWSHVGDGDYVGGSGTFIPMQYRKSWGGQIYTICKHGSIWLCICCILKISVCLVYEVAVDLWSNIIAMEYPFLHIHAYYKIGSNHMSNTKYLDIN